MNRPPIWVGIACLLLVSCTTPTQDQKPRGVPDLRNVPGPAIAQHLQQNADGTPVPFNGITQKNEVLLGAVVDVPGSVNVCPTLTVLELERWRTGDYPTQVPTEPHFKTLPCNAPNARCQLMFDPRFAEPLTPDAGYQWQARAITRHYWRKNEYGDVHCRDLASQQVGEWQEFRPGITPPGAAAFRTPTVWKDVHAEPHSIRNVAGAIQQGDVQSLVDDDGQHLTVRSAGNPRRVAVDVVLPVLSGGRQRDWTFELRLQSAQDCSGQVSLWDARNSAWTAIAPISVGSQEGKHAVKAQLGGFLEAIAGLPAGYGGVTLRVECQRPGGVQFDFSIDRVHLVYQVPA